MSRCAWLWLLASSSFPPFQNIFNCLNSHNSLHSSTFASLILTLSAPEIVAFSIQTFSLIGSFVPSHFISLCESTKYIASRTGIQVGRIYLQSTRVRKPQVKVDFAFTLCCCDTVTIPENQHIAHKSRNPTPSHLLNPRKAPLKTAGSAGHLCVSI